MPRQIFDSSPKVGQKRATSTRSKYPWKQLEQGKSFGVAKDEAKFSTIRTAAHRMGNKLSKKFVVVDHGDHGFEVACVEAPSPMPIPPAILNAEPQDKIAAEKAPRVHPELEAARRLLKTDPEGVPVKPLPDPETAPEPLGWKLPGPTVVTYENNTIPEAGKAALAANSLWKKD